MKPKIIDLGQRNEFIMFFMKSPAPEVASSNNGLLKACSFSHIYFKGFLPLKHSTVKDKMFSEAQEEHKQVYAEALCVTKMVHFIHRSSESCQSAT